MNRNELIELLDNYKFKSNVRALWLNQIKIEFISWYDFLTSKYNEENNTNHILEPFNI